MTMPAHRTTSAAIIGLGSRGLSVLERIVTLAKRAGPAAGSVLVEVIDPSCSGAGVHDPWSPDYLLLNTTCSQISMFPDRCTVGEDVDESGPTLYQWVTERGLRIGSDGFTVGPTGRPIHPTDYLPRRLLGEYLGWFLDQLQRRAPEHVQIILHRGTAVDIRCDADGALVVVLSDGTQIPAQYAFLTTGHTPNQGPDNSRLIAEPYPLPERLAKVAASDTVAIAGFGLSAMDLICCLTIGRGGRYAGVRDRLTYLPSGREPAILVYSRSGVPCRARPLTARFDDGYEPWVLTKPRIDASRRARNGPLDLDEDVLPLIHTEMRIAYRLCQARCTGPDAEHMLWCALTAAGQEGICALLDELDERLGPFDAPATLDGSIGMLVDDSAAYQQWLTDAIRRDLAEGTLGLARSPVKASLDVLRQLRDTVRYIVDFGGLAGPSLDEFNRRTVPMMNRAIVGPQYERHAELLALIEAGVVSVPFGPAPAVTYHAGSSRWTLSSTMLREPHSREADWVVAAHIPPPAVDKSASPLIRTLHRKGWMRPHRPASPYVRGVDVDPDQHPLDANGRAETRLWVLGMLCEGVTFYNNLVPSPNVYSRPVFDAHRCVTAMFASSHARPIEERVAR
jgi:uncharacterized NAD(P)/FAD-binding protein YdhS